MTEDPWTHRKPVHLEGRDPNLPQMWEVESHPKVDNTVKGRGRYFMYEFDPSKEGQLKYHKFAEKMVFPEGTTEAVKKAGMCSLSYTIHVGILSTF